MSEENLETLWVIVDETPQTPQEDGSKDATSPGNPWMKKVASAVGVPQAVKVRACHQLSQITEAAR
jgi:hypothetical protein